MSSITHGVGTSKLKTSVSTPVTVASGVPFAVGAAPVQIADETNVNKVVLVNSYDEAVAAFGYSDDWEKYPLCEVIYTAFVLYGVAPLLLVNILDPASDDFTVAVKAASMTAVNNKITLPFETVASTIVVTGKTLNTDYAVTYTNSACVIEFFETTTTASVAYSKVVPEYATGQQTDIPKATYEVSDNTVTLPADTIASSIVITGKTLTTDYTVAVVSTGVTITFTATTDSAEIAYSRSVSVGVQKTDIIGGIDASTLKASGLQLIDDCYPTYKIAPDIILCPGWSNDPNVAAAMVAKTEGINAIFEAIAICDISTKASTGATKYTDVPSWKSDNNFTNRNMIACWPMLKLGDTTFNHSTQLACLIAQVDNDGEMGDGTPCESASNKAYQADSMVLADGTEVLLDLQKANYLNDNGVVTALNLTGGFNSWGDYTACYPSNTDVADYMYSINRMFKWVQKTVTLTYWSSIDGRMTRLLIDAVLQGVNDWLAGLVTEGKLLGGRIEFREDENSETALLAGKAKFHVYISPPTPLVLLEFVFEYDASYLSTALLASS